MTSLPASTSEKFLLSPYNEKYLYSCNRNTFLKESSSTIYQKFYGEQFNKETCFYIIFGTDSGLLANYIMQQETPHNSRYLFIELPQLMEKVLSTLEHDYDEDVFAFTTPDKWKEIANNLEISVYIHNDNLRYIKSFGGSDAFIPDYHLQNVEVVKAIEAVFFFTRALVGVFPFMTKQLMNITENKYSSALFNNIFKDKTCVILGGGPSLDNDIDWIKSNQDNIVIFAVSRIAKTLLKHNLIPHIVASVDPYDVSFDISKDLLHFPKEVLFLHANCVNTNLLSQWHGQSIFIGERFPWAESEDKGCSVMGGPTVTNTALKVAIEMGFSNILLSGVDLCYSKTGISHASGSNEAKVGPTLGQPGVWVETYAGNKAETHIAFDNAVLALSQQAKKAQDLGICIYNLSEDAAKAENIDHIPTSALSFENETDDIWQLIANTIPTENSETIKKQQKFILTKVNKMLKDIQAIKLLAEEALSCNVKLFKIKGKESENFKFKLRMDKIENKIDRSYKKAADFVKNFGLNKFIKSAQVSHENWTDETIEETGRLYYQAYVDSSITLRILLKETIERIKSRIEEEKASPNFNILFAQWEKDKQFGRATVWQANTKHQTIELSAEIQEKFTVIATKYNEVLNNQNTAHLARSKQHSSLDGVKRKIVILFNQHNIDALRAMNASLASYCSSNSNSDEAVALYNLSQAYLCTLSNEYTQALSYFDKLADNDFTEDELQQIASLSIKVEQYQQAEATLKKLAEINTMYCPQYAKILSLLGRIDASADVYSQYLTDNPEDIQTWFALGKLYFDSNSYPSAKMAFQYVLLKDPLNVLANEYIRKL